jgi:hypothetical protein
VAIKEGDDQAKTKTVSKKEKLTIDKRDLRVTRSVLKAITAKKLEEDGEGPKTQIEDHGPDHLQRKQIILLAKVEKENTTVVQTSDMNTLQEVIVAQGDKATGDSGQIKTVRQTMKGFLYLTCQDHLCPTTNSLKCKQRRL